jgi:hypothetical protein
MELREGGSAIGPEEATLVERAKGGSIAGAPGDEFGIRGRHFVAGFSACDDTGSGSPAAQTVPARDVRVEFLQGGRRWELGSVPADKGSRIASKLKVPADARPGRATVRATYGQGPPESPDGRMSVEARFFVTG